jgi:hypothetical protein
MSIIALDGPTVWTDGTGVGEDGDVVAPLGGAEGEVVDGGTVVDGAPGLPGALTAGVVPPPPPPQATSVAASVIAMPKVTSRGCRMLES